MRIKNREKFNFAFISFVILSIIILQAAASLGIVSKFFYNDRLWPILDYPMYSSAHYQGDSIDQYFLYGLLEDGSELPIPKEDLGLNFWKFLRGPVYAIIQDDVKLLNKYVKLYEDLHNQRLIGLRLENQPLILTKQGINPIPAQIVKTIQLGGAKKTEYETN